jgi:hypothetical protein
MPNVTVTRVKTYRPRSRSDRQKISRMRRRTMRQLNSGLTWMFVGTDWKLCGVTSTVTKYAGYYDVRYEFTRGPDTDFTPLFGT